MPRSLHMALCMLCAASCSNKLAGTGGGMGGSAGSGGTGGVTGGERFPLRVSDNKRYLVTAGGAPFLIAGDAPQCLTARVSVDDMGVFYTMRAGQGYNAMWVNALCTTYTGGNAEATTFDGIAPFTGKLAGGEHDLSKPNPAFFERVDAAVSAAAARGIVLFLDPIETGGFLPTLRANGLAAARAYGRWLGQRYAAAKNIVWMSGNDFRVWLSVSDDDLVQAVALGIKDTAPQHLQTVELDYPIAMSSLDDAGHWESIISINTTYTYYPTYAQLYVDYNRANHLPNVMIEANYENENHEGGSHLTNAHDIRTQYYWSNLSGATGSFYGNLNIWSLDKWLEHMNDPGAVQMTHVQALFLPRAWQRLVPDQNHTVVTSGLGTFASAVSAQDNDYATTARTDDGGLVMTYMPTARAVTVDMTKLAGPATGRWFDPTSGAYLPISGSPFANNGTRTFTPSPDKHDDGFDDWVLVLETNPPP